MKVLNIVGKIDSRSLAYPIIRALSLHGLTGVITDDGAYRRLYHGKGNIGSVNAVDICVCPFITDESIHSLDNSGVPYEHLVIVSNDYVYDKADGLIICHSLDRSMMALPGDDEDEEFIIPALEKAKNGGDASKSEDSENSETGDPKETDETNETNETVTIEYDRIVIPEGIKNTEVQIAYAAAPKKGMPGISLKDNILSYIFKCEEQKRLEVYPDKGYNTVLAKIIADVYDIPANEFLTLLMKEEGAPGITKGKGKGRK